MGGVFLKLFTLMTCTYNNAEMLRLTIDGMIALDNLSEYVEKIIIVDNASTDSTYYVVQDYMHRFPEIISYVYEPKLGVTHARRHAADIQTPWLIFVDDDNLLNHDYLTVVSDVITNNIIGICKMT
jgi:glycosyltransferase involved in cell wall biosynthesis